MRASVSRTRDTAISAQLPNRDLRFTSTTVANRLRAHSNPEKTFDLSPKTRVTSGHRKAAFMEVNKKRYSANFSAAGPLVSDSQNGGVGECVKPAVKNSHPFVEFFVGGPLSEEAPRIC
jgi:hypothetical protein